MKRTRRNLRETTVTAKSLLTILFSFVIPTAYTSAQAHLIQVIQQAPTATSVRTSTGSALASSGIVLAIKVASSNGLVVPDGTVVVSDGSTAMGSVPVIDGEATMTQVFSSLGTHQLIACYSGDNNFSSSCSSPASLTALAPYTLKQSNPSAVIENSTPFVDKLSVLPAKGFVGVVQLACQASSDQCALSPSSVSFSGDGKPQIVQASFLPSAPSPAGGLIALPLIGLIGFQIRNKQSRSRAVAFFATATMLLGLAGCGPNVEVPFNAADFTMCVNATSGTYSQSVMYQIQVDTDIVKQ
jgi:Bacterial Ig-like domain (group 3)